MFKLVILSMLMLPLSACVSIGGTQIAGVAVAKDADALWVGNIPAAQLAACVAGKLNSTAQPAGGGFTVARPGSDISYRILPFSDRYERYITRVDVLGSADDDTAVGSCMSTEKVRMLNGATES